MSNELEIRTKQIGSGLIGEVVGSGRLSTPQQALDLLGTAWHLGCDAMIIHERNLDPEFFELRTGFAGEVLQKYSNYKMRLAIVGSFEKFQSKSLNDFITECNRGRHIYFTDSMEEAETRFSSKKK